jgi:hypothetical protein
LLLIALAARVCSYLPIAYAYKRTSSQFISFAARVRSYPRFATAFLNFSLPLRFRPSRRFAVANQCPAVPRRCFSIRIVTLALPLVYAPILAIASHCYTFQFVVFTELFHALPLQ